MADNYFKKGFNAVYNAKVKCPECKLEIPANANICPHCMTDLKSGNYDHLNRWQGTAYKILFLIAAIITIALFFNTNLPGLLNIIIGFAILGFGKIIITQIQSFINRQN
jgi:uncharacterized paraquat-inducible protein A